MEKLLGPIITYILLVCAPAFAWPECGQKINNIPEYLFQISTGVVASGRIASISVLASRDITVQIKNTDDNAKLYSVEVASPERIRAYCATGGGLAPKGRIMLKITEAPLGAPVVVRISTVGGDSEKEKFLYTIFGDLSPDWKLTPNDLVRRRLYVYIFENAPLAGSARAHTDEATKIWRSVGIDFKPLYKKIVGDQVAQLLGKDRKLQGFFGEDDLYSGEYKDRERVQALKPHPDAFAIIFAQGDLGLAESTRADPYRHQAYISEDVFQPSLGRTVAHEMGHLLLGEGHTGKLGVPWTSGLMRADPSTERDISDSDAKIARNRARQIPE